MSASLALPVLWGQVFLQGVPVKYRPVMAWLFILGEPNYTTPDLLGGVITWIKVISLFCLLGWVASWLATALKERTVARGTWLDLAGLAALIGGVATVLVSTLQASERIPVYKIGGVYLITWMTLAVGLVLFAWVEQAIWATIRRHGRRGDLVVLVGMHLALAIGIVYGIAMRGAANTLGQTVVPVVSWGEGFNFGLRMSGTYMGYVVLVRVIGLVLAEVWAVRPRRLYSIAQVSVIEATRRMWAPWVVIVVFLVILAFTHWFLQPPRPAEMGRLFVGTLTLLCSLLLTVMVTLLTPLSLPQDIQNQTIYTVVSKPVRRIELVWGRMLGFMSIVTALVAVFGIISLVYLQRTVGGTIAATETAAIKAASQNKLAEARQLREQADQIRTRMAARVPIYGGLSFLDSKGTPHNRGIDVGAEQSMREPRSHIEGATPATAIWTFGLVREPFLPANAPPSDYRLPVNTLLVADTVEGLLNRSYELKFQIANDERLQAEGKAASNVKDVTARIASARAELERVNASYTKRKADADALEAKAAEADTAKNAEAATRYRLEAAAFHTAPIPLEMTFNVYRTTKGRVGEPVYAELEAKNPATGAEYRNIFAIREYYTNKQVLPASILAGSQGNLRIEIRCISPTQYLGMAQSDLFLLARSGDFGTNFMKGLFGVWLQAMVLTAIGVFAGTFLSWPVALLTTIAFFVAGQVAFAYLLEFTRQSLLGGGPFESAIRLLEHNNQMSDLTPTLYVVVAKTCDALVMPVMSRLVYIVPNFAALDVSNTVADGFAVSWPLLISNTLLAFAYALPFSIAGYFILKNREVAA